MKRRFMALVLCFCMCLSLLPMGALATPVETDVASIGDTGYATLQAAFGAAQDGQTITLLSDVTMDTYCDITCNGSVTLDLNNHNVKTNGLYVECAGLTITGTGTIESTKDGAAPVSIDSNFATTAKTTLVIDKNVTLKGYNVEENKYGLNIFGSNDASKNTIDVVINGTIEGVVFVLGNLTNTENAININVNADAKITSPGTGIALNGYAHVTISDGAMVTGKTGIEVRAGVLDVNGGTITGTGAPTVVNSNGSGTTSTGAGIAVAQHTTKLPITVKITDGSVNGYSAFYESNPETNSSEDIGKITLNIAGGNYSTNNEGTVPVYSQDKTGFISGGTFSSDVSAYVADGSMAGKIADGKYIVATPDVNGEEGSAEKKAILVENDDGSITASDSAGYRIFKPADLAPAVPAEGKFKPLVSAIVDKVKDANKNVEQIASLEIVVTLGEPTTTNDGRAITHATPTLVAKNSSGEEIASVPVDNNWLADTTAISVTLPAPENATTVNVHKYADSQFVSGSNTFNGNPEKSFQEQTVSNGSVTITTDTFCYFEVVPVYTVTFHSNFGDPEVTAAQYFEPGESKILNPGSDFPLTREGYTFSGWSTNENGGGTTYSDGQSVTLSENTTLYAQWRRNGGGGGSSIVNQIHVPTSVDNGTVAVTPKSAAQGRTVTVTPKPDQGYETAGVTVTDAKGNNIPVTKNADGTYTFTMPASAVTVTPTFTKAQEAPAEDGSCQKDAACPISKFTDASPTAWYHDGVHWALDKEIMKGTGDTTFAPNGNTTRAMVVTMLWRLEGEPQGTTSSFTDVPADAWYAQAVNWAAETGVVRGITETKFSPNSDVTREQLAAILYRYAQVKGVDVSIGEDTNILSYQDAAAVSDWAMSAMQWACGGGIITGMGDGTLAPGHNATRAQIATMFMRFCEAAEK